MLRLLRLGQIQIGGPIRSQIIRRAASDSAKQEPKKSPWKAPIYGAFGCYALGFLITLSTQLPLDPERMTIEKQQKMTREELEAFDKEQQEKGWMKNLIDLFPSGARWQEAFKIVVDKAIEAPLSSWGGLKLGYDCYFESHEPEWEVALPPPLEPPYIQPRFTITTELLDVIICPEYDSEKGWRFKKRPGAEYFLKKIGYPNTELVAYTEASPSDVQMPLMKLFKKLEKMEIQNGGFLYQLYRNSCKYDGQYKKELKILGRNYQNVIHIDIAEDSVSESKQQENVISIRKPSDLEEGELDMTLYDLADFIEHLVKDSGNIEDIRDELEKYKEEGKTMPEVFRARQVDEELERLETQENMKKLTENNSNIILTKTRKGRFL